jgi:hypothetical protein
MEIAFTNSNRSFTIDDADWLCIAEWSDRFYLASDGYAASTQNGRPMIVHRKIMGLYHYDGKYVDHIDGNKLNNRRYNLRVCTNQQNCSGKINTVKRAKIKSKYKGVAWDKPTNKWRAQVGYKYLILYLGVHATEELAAVAYNQKASELFGEFARLNQIA